jgi:uncharacterized membrane protein YciS (DUF1049 family)
VSTPQPPGIPEPPATTTPPAAPPSAEPAAEEDRPSTWQPLLYFKISALLVAIAYATAFVVQNSQQINVDFVFATAKVRLVWEILLLLAIGLVGGILLSQLYRHRRRTQLAKKSGEPRDSRANLRRRDKAVGKPS